MYYWKETYNHIYFVDSATSRVLEKIDVTYLSLSEAAYCWRHDDYLDITKLKKVIEVEYPYI